MTSLEGGLVQDYVVTDDLGRRTQFTGEKLVAESTDSMDAEKRSWLDVTVWRTQGGSFVVERQTHYRIRHLSDMCRKADGYELVPATELDTQPCTVCNPKGVLDGGYAQAARITVDAYHTPGELISGLRSPDGKYSNLSRMVLADVSEQDSRVDEAWNTVVVP